MATAKLHVPLEVVGPTGATAATRYAGATTSGAPASGSFSKGDFIIAQDGAVWICTVAGSPGTWAEVGSGGVTVASSLPAGPAEGDTVALRLSSSPFEFGVLVFDSTYNKWVMAGEFLLASCTQAAKTTTSTSFASLAGTELFRNFIPWKVRNTAGVVLQVRLTCRLQISNAASTASCAAQVFSGDVNSADAAAQGAEFATVTKTTDTLIAVKDSGWTDHPGGLTIQDQVTMDIRIKASANTATLRECSIWGRWVAAPT